MKKTFIAVSSFLGAFVPYLVSAEAVCKLNGQVVPCSQIGDTVGGFVGGFFWLFIVLWAVIMILSFAGFILWILMIIHAATKNIENKAIWIIVLCLTQILGAVIYYFVVKRPFDRAHNNVISAGTTPTSTPNTSVNNS